MSRFLSLSILVSYKFTMIAWVKTLAGTYSIVWSKVCRRCMRKICCTETLSLTMCLSAATDRWSFVTLVSLYFYRMNKPIVKPCKALITTRHLKFRNKLGMRSPLTYGRLACLLTNFLQMSFPSNPKRTRIKVVLTTLWICPHLSYQRVDSHNSIKLSSTPV